MMTDDPTLAASTTDSPTSPRGPVWLLGVLLALYTAGCASLFLPRPWWKLATGLLFGTASTLLERRAKQPPTLEELGRPRNRRERRRAERRHAAAQRVDAPPAASTAIAGIVVLWVADHFGYEVIDRFLRQPTFAVGFGAFLLAATLYAWWTGRLR